MAEVGIKIKATDEASSVFGKVASEAGKLQSSVASVGAGFAALGGAAVAGLSVIGFGEKIKESIDLADSFNKLSQKTGVAVESLSRLNYAAGLSDVSTEALSTGLKKLNLNISAAANGSAEQATLFKSLGISVKDVAGNVVSADKVLSQLADRFAESGDNADKTAIAVAALGKSGADLIPFLNAGSKGLGEMGDEAQKLGIVLGSDFAKSAEEFNDNIAKISLASQGLFVTLAGDLVKGLGATAKAMAEASVEGGKFAAVIAGIETLLTGDDLYKANVDMVKGTELLMAAENALDKARAAGDTARIARLEKAVALRREELQVTQNYRAMLEGDAKKAEADNKPKPTTSSAAIKAAVSAISKPTGAPPRDTANPFAAEQDAAKEWAKALEAAGKASQDLVAKNLDLSKSQADLKTYMESAAAAINEKTNPAMNEMVKTALEANIALEAMGKLADVVEAQQKRTANAEDETQKERDRVAAIGLTTEAVAELGAARLEEMAIAKERTLLAADEIDLSGEYSAAIKAEAKTLRERAALLRTGASKEVAIEAAKAASDEWKRGWEETDRIARDVFTSWATEGGNAAQKIGETLKKALLSAVYEATLKPLVMQVYASVAGGGFAGTALQAASGFGSIGSAGSGIGALSGIASAVGNFSSTAGAVANGVYLGAGELGSLGFGEALSTGLGAVLEGSFASGFATLAGTLGPLIGGAALLSNLMAYKVESKGNGLTATVGGASGLPSGSVGLYNEFEQTGGLVGGGTTINRDWSVADQGVATYITGSVQAITASNRAYADALGLSSESIDSFTKNIEVSLTGLDAAGQQAAINAALSTFAAEQAAATYGQALVGVARDGETTAQTLQRLGTDLTGTNAMFADLGYTLFDVSVAGANAASTLVAAFGNLQAAQAQLGSFYQNFYSQEEQQANTYRTVQSDLANAGFNFTVEDLRAATREDIRAAVDGLAAGTDTADGAARYAAAVRAANTLATVKPVVAPTPAPTVAPLPGATQSGGIPYVDATDTALTAWEEATAAIVDAMRDLRVTLLDSGPDSFAKLQAQFVIETASAKAGNVAAAQELPELVRSLADASKDQFTSGVQRDLFIARLIQSLGEVAGVGGAGANLSIPRFAAGGYHRGGWAIVGEQGPELVNMPPARVFNATDTSAMLGGGTDPAVLEELRAMRAELAAIRASSGSTAISSGKTAKVLDAAANNGQPISTKVVA